LADKGQLKPMGIDLAEDLAKVQQHRSGSRASVFWQRVNGMPKFPNSVKRLTHPETGNGGFSWLFFIICQQERGIVWGRTGLNPSGIDLAVSSKRDETFVQCRLDNMRADQEMN
jgi:hypothetical protein